MGFFNHSRDERIRDVNRRKLQGVVVNNNDPMQLQRIKVRIHDLHDNIADEDLPWQVPQQMSPYSGAADIGDHGPIPANGTKIWVGFDDDTQYHGAFGGAVIITQNKIPEFTSSGNNDGGNNQDTNNSGSTATSGQDPEQGGAIGQSGGSKQTILPDASQYPFYQNYPQSHGSVNQTGTILARDQMTDVHVQMHVTSTGDAVDGKGNTFESVNGDTPRNDNPNAKKIFPTGKTMVIKGDWTLYTTGNVVVNSSGNTNITTTGNTQLSSQGTMNVIANGNTTVSSKAELDITASNNVVISGAIIKLNASNQIQFNAPSVVTEVPIVVGTSGSPNSPSNASAAATHASPQPRTRPNPTVQANDENY